MEWLTAHWWQVALIAVGVAILLEIQKARADLHEIFEAIWTLPGMKERAEHTRWMHDEGLTSRSPETPESPSPPRR